MNIKLKIALMIVTLIGVVAAVVVAGVRANSRPAKSGPVYYTRWIEEPSDECGRPYRRRSGVATTFRHGCAAIKACVLSTFEITDIPMEERRTLSGLDRWLFKNTHPKNCNRNTDKKYYVTNSFGVLDHPRVRNDAKSPHPPGRFFN